MSTPLWWIEQGCDLDRDVLPAVTATAMRERRKRLRGIRSWEYFTHAVAEAKGMDFIHPALSPDGSRLYVYGLERAPFTTEGIEVDTAPNGIWEIDTDTMKPLRHLCAGERWSGDLRVSPDGRLLALLDLDGDRLLVLDTASGQHVAAVYVDYFSPDAQIVGFGSGDWRW